MNTAPSRRVLWDLTSYLAVGLLAFLLVVVMASHALAQEEGNDTSAHEDQQEYSLYVPNVPGPDNSDPMSGSSNRDQPEAQEGKEWSRYDSTELHISFAYPPDWQLDAPNLDQLVIPNDLPEEYQALERLPSSAPGYVLSLFPPDGHALSGNKVEITIQSFEISDGQDLFEWQEGMRELSSFIHSPDAVAQTQVRDITSQDLSNREELEQVLHTQVETLERDPINQTVWFSHGNLVYIVNSFAYSDEMQLILDALVSSIEFAPDAPRNLNDLYGAEDERQSLEETLDTLRETQGLVEECDIVCRDAKVSQNIVAGPSPTPDPVIEEEERRYYDQQVTDNRQQDVQAASVQATAVSGNQKALPSNWLSPIHTSNPIPVLCGSPAHTGGAEFAVDASVGIGTTVFAAKYGVVVKSLYDPYVNPITQTSYGSLILVRTDLNIAGESRQYYHAYTHLLWRFVSQGDTVYRGTTIGASGNSGGVYPHLHFHIRDQSYTPVDATPVLGFTPDLDYPSANATCGQIESVNSAPIIVEPVAFTQRYHPRNSHYWLCYQGGHTNECYMRSDPNWGANYNYGSPPPSPLNSPELRYDSVYVPQSAIYRIWVCGNGGNGADDSLHTGINDYAASTSDQLTGYIDSSWVWKSQTMQGGSMPYFYMNSGDQTVNVWMREDGMRFDRMLLTSSLINTPPNSIACGGH